jgi:Xaa-Pro dipeptidase
MEMEFIRRAFRPGEFTTRGLVESARLEKDQDEIMAMRKAVSIAEAALTATIPIIKPGLSELEIASELVIQLLRHGSRALPFEPIIASGPNTASSHAVPGERRISNGDLLLFDWGASYDGYISDLTRTFAVGSIDPEFSTIYETVLRANAAGIAAARPGAAAGDLDQAARSVIEQAGFGPLFTHRTGHGIGLEAHEEPYIRGGHQLKLRPGMAFTIEPGIYIQGRGGVRIEDNVVITETGADVLSSFDRTLTILG